MTDEDTAESFVRMPKDVLKDLNVTNDVAFNHKPITYHAWVQRGQDVVCKTCPNHHSAIGAIPPGYMLQRNEKGELDVVKITPTPQPK